MGWGSAANGTGEACAAWYSEVPGGEEAEAKTGSPVYMIQHSSCCVWSLLMQLARCVASRLLKVGQPSARHWTDI